MVFVYIPKLGHGKGKAKKQTAELTLQDEHNSLSLITKQIIKKFMKIHEEGGFWTEVMGRSVCVKQWILGWEIRLEFREIPQLIQFRAF